MLNINPICNTPLAYDQNTATFLQTTPNVGGFNRRKYKGVVAGNNMLQKINSGDFKFNKATDILDIVAHSMGYAYSVGMIKALKAGGIKFGRFYIIAPENACSEGTDWSDFSEAWQYGSNLGAEKQDKMFLQDGVAPQCECTGITNAIPKQGKILKTGRVFIPENAPNKGYLGSHSIANYGWIFNIINDPNNPNGYVKPR